MPTQRMESPVLGRRAILEPVTSLYEMEDDMAWSGSLSLPSGGFESPAHSDP
jgi:hypothetical protein